MTDAEKRMRAWCDAQRGGNRKGGCDVCDEVMAQLAKGVCVTSGQGDASKKVGGGSHDARGTSAVQCEGKKVGRASALSHARDSHEVCDTPDTQTHTHTSDASSRTHTHTHTDDASACKHDTCDG